MTTTHTDSSIIEHHDDGSWTETTTITHYPATRGQKAAAWGALGVLAMAPVIPLAVIYGIEKFEEKREERRAKKAAKKNEK
jgi:hypothetical protein